MPLRFPASPDGGRSLRVGLLTPHDTTDRRAFSGTAFQVARALQAREGLAIRLIGEHHGASRPLRRLLGRRGRHDHIPANDLEGLDAIMGLVASRMLDRLPERLDLPILHVTDATPGFLREAYGWQVPPSADATEARVISRASRTVYSAEFMAARGREEFGSDAGRMVALPFGINFDALPDTLPAKPTLDRLNLLFVGIDWTRKGGDIALAALDLLRAGGIDATLTVAGRIPDNATRHPAVISLGFLDKNRTRDRARLSEAYAKAHVLLLPSRGDCTPMVLAEAMAHGTPVIASDTGGIAELVGHDGAGHVLAQDAAPAGWAQAIRALTGDPDTFAMMSDAAHDRARTRYSWSAWAAGIETILRDIPRSQGAQAA